MTGVDSADVLERFESCLPLVDKIARQIERSCGGRVELDDLLSYGREALLEASRRYDSSRETSFGAFAGFRVRGAMLDCIRQMATVPRRAYERLLAEHAAQRASQDLAANGLTSTNDVERSFNEHLAAMATAAALDLAGTAVEVQDGALYAVAQDNPEEDTSRAELRAVVRAFVERLPTVEAVIVKAHYLEGRDLDEVASTLNLSKSWASRLHTRALERLAKQLREIAEG